MNPIFKKISEEQLKMIKVEPINPVTELEKWLLGQVENMVAGFDNITLRGQDTYTTSLTINNFVETEDKE